MTIEDNNQAANMNSVEPVGECFEWQTHPMRRRPLAAVLVTVFIFTVAIMLYSTTSSQLFTVLTLVVLFASTAKFYLPTKFKMTDKEVIIKSTTQTIKKKWSNFRSFYPDKNGVLLSPFVEPSRLENFRGMYLIFNDNENEVVSFIKKHIDTDSETETGETT